MKLPSEASLLIGGTCKVRDNCVLNSGPRQVANGDRFLGWSGLIFFLDEKPTLHGWHVQAGGDRVVQFTRKGARRGPVGDEQAGA